MDVSAKERTLIVSPIKGMSIVDRGSPLSDSLSLVGRTMSMSGIILSSNIIND